MNIINRIQYLFSEKALQKTIAFFIGLGALLWFLIRVIPKPQRATYPCMQATAPVLSSFIIWMLSAVGMLKTWRKAKMNFVKLKYLYSLLFGIACISFSIIFLVRNSFDIYAMFESPVIVNAPIGIAKGIFPGRVAWVYNPNAAKWNGTGNYWVAGVNPQAEYNKSFTAGINSLSGGSTDSESWDKIFKWFNSTHNRQVSGYQTGDKIAIKINQNNSAASAANCGNVSNANPQSCFACVRSLVNAGVPQGDIWIGDPGRAVTDNIFNAIHTAFPNVHVVDYFGNNGRVTTTNVANVFPNNDVYPNESACFYNARYIINMPLLKGHVGQGITFGSKNFYGINGLKPVWSDNGGKHPGSSALTNYMTNANFGGKTVLWVMDAMYPNRNLDGTPQSKWMEAPFNGRPASSFIMSLDGVAEESVSLDFFYQHYADEINANGGLSNAETYLHNAALANAGVHEHWNNNSTRQYSKNINPNVVNGIELVNVFLISTGIHQPVDDVESVKLFCKGDGYLQLSIPDGSTIDRFKLELFDNKGSVLISKTIDSVTNKIYVGQLHSGTYLYKVYSQNNSFSGKIIIH